MAWVDKFTGLRKKYATAIQYRRIHHWSKYLFRHHNHLCLDIFESLQQNYGIDQNAFQGFLTLKPLDHYCDNITSLFTTGFRDQNLFEFIKKQYSLNYLFTGGGIIPKKFFDIRDSRFIHIHPGFLPEIRGGDGLLWSTMLSSRPSATCFYMNSGIDTGDIIHAMFLPRINLSHKTSQLEEKMIYRLLYCFIDPWVRSIVFKKAQNGPDRTAR